LSFAARTSAASEMEIAEPAPASPARDVAPIRRQYLQIKERFPDTILLFRLGDFYETFEHDAETAAAVLDIALTGRDMGRGVRVAMAGIPHHAAETYIARLVAAGHKVAVCEQIGSVERGKGLIDRDVTRVVTPGTVTDPAMLDGRRNTYLAAAVFAGARCGFAHADLSTGEFAATELTAADGAAVRETARRELLRLGAVEVVVPPACHDDAAEPRDWLPEGVTLSTVDGVAWNAERGAETLQRQFAVASLDGFGLGGKRLAVQAAGALLAYLHDTQRSGLSQLAPPSAYVTDGFMGLDPQALRTLELMESARGERRHGLIAILDETRTAMGARLLRRWLSQPLLDLAAIAARQDAVQRFVADPASRARIRQLLGKIADIERLANRAVTAVIMPRELGFLRQSLAAVTGIEGDGFLEVVPLSPGARTSAARLTGVLERALPDEPPSTLGSGEAIRPGFAPELDQHQRATRDARAWIAGLERQERERTGIRSLKVGFNRVIGYYLEISAVALAAAEREMVKAGGVEVLPPEYVVRQTLAGSTRYTTPRLKEYESQVLGAQETLANLEADVFRRVVGDVAASVAHLREIAAAIAFVDVVSTLAEVAAIRNYARPVVDDSRVIAITAGRHPTLESLLPSGVFVPNDALLDADAGQITILTGPNMAGKSSWLRQTALIVLLAQIGSFVPAASARIGLVDRIFTRIGAQDDIVSGQSTFMVEMLETASILNQATPRSLVLLDEIGRGTSTWDGLAIARAVVEHLHNAPRLGCRTLFATHFHELTELATILPRVACARMDVLEEGDRVVFLHRVVPGAIDRSYGIHVAELAGLPRAATRRARSILSELEESAKHARNGRRRAMRQPPPETSSLQLTLFAPPSPLQEALAALDVESLSPLEALTKLFELKRMAEAERAREG
jgi:DNA mismatch repair protein MutS